MQMINLKKTSQGVYFQMKENKEFSIY